MTETDSRLEFGILVIGAYLLFGICDLGFVWLLFLVSWLLKIKQLQPELTKILYISKESQQKR